MYKKLPKLTFKQFFFLLLFKSFFCFGLNESIVMLMGACNSGKSTINREIISKKKNWFLIEEDFFYYQELPKFLAQAFPESYQKIIAVIAEKNILNAVKRGQYCFKEKADKQKIQDAMDASKKIQNALDRGPQSQELHEKFHTYLRELILAKIDAAIAEEKNILLDIWSIKTREALTEKYPEKNIIRILLYNPIEQSYQQFKKRNQQAKENNDLRNVRFWAQWLGSNTRFYEFLEEKKENFLSYISQSELEAIFNVIEQQIIQKKEGTQEALFSRNEMNLLHLKSYKQDWLSDRQNAVIYLYPKQEYDLIIINEGKPEALANQILEFLEENK